MTDTPIDLMGDLYRENTLAVKSIKEYMKQHPQDFIKKNSWECTLIYYYGLKNKPIKIPIKKSPTYMDLKRIHTLMILRDMPVYDFLDDAI